jgi:threonine dehydratase
MSDAPDDVSVESIKAAAQRIAAYVHRTPLLASHQLGEMFGCEIQLKCENLQKVGAFKARGAHNAVMSLSDDTAARGVATHSSGNHAAALALAARNRGISATVVMPENAPSVKKAAVAGYGAEILFCEPTLAAREAALAELESRTGAHIVHPYEDPAVISGQGTVGLEIAQQSGDTPPELIVAPVGGGGLLAGVSVALAADPKCAVVGAEPTGADDARRSFDTGRLHPQLAPDTIADGLLTSLGRLNFELIRRHADAILTAPDAAIVEAMKLIWSRTKQVVEPSAAVALAVVMASPERFRGKRVVLIMSGGNVDLERLPWSPC